MEQRETPQQSRTGIRETIKKFKPKIDEAGDVLTSHGLPPDTPKFIQIRRGVAKTLYKRDEKVIIDPLTGALSRAEFMRKLNDETVRMRRHGKPSTLVFWDLNDLKKINDTLGHAAGDAKLVEFATILQKDGRGVDSLGRLGGDEFLSLLPETNAEGAMVLWNRVNTIFRERGINVSAGIAEIDLNDPQFSITKADEAMYKAKGASKITSVNAVVTHRS